MALNDWADGAGGGTPLSAARLNERDAAIVALQQAVADLTGRVEVLEAAE